MITDKTIDQCLIELKRMEYQLMALRSERRAALAAGEVACSAPGSGEWGYFRSPLHAAAKRASMDLTRKLAALRTGR